MPKLKGLLDTARTKLTGLLGDFPQGFNAGAVAGFPGWAGDMAYMADTARLALTGADQQAAPENYVGTTDYIAKQAGYPVPQTLSGQLGAAVGGLMSPGPGDLAKFAPVLSAIPFWHGSPHKYDAVDLSKIGTGEGAQAYGWGYYGAGAKDTAEQYAKNVKNDAAITDVNAELSRLAKIMGEDEVPGSYRKYRSQKGADAAAEYDRLLGARQGIVDDPGQMYRGEYRWPDPAKESATPLTGEDLLQWDRPLSEQPESVRKAFSVKLRDFDAEAKLVAEAQAAGVPVHEMPGYTELEKAMDEAAPFTRETGEQLLQRLFHEERKRLGGNKGAAVYQQAVSERLKSLGIPGIRYLDGMSRDGGQGTYNIVMFDEKGIKLLERNGSPIEDFAARRAGKAKPYKEAMGLPMDEASRMQRAGEMGFDTENPVYHGTRTKGEAIDAFNLDKAGSKTDAGYMGKGIYFGDKKTANVYAGHYEFDPGHFPEGGAVYPSYLSLKSPLILEDKIENGRSVDLEVLARDALGIPREATAEQVTQAALSQGYDGAVYSRGPGMYREYVAYKPEQIRSKFAAFDPAKKDSANLLAGAAATALGLGLAKQQLSEQERRNGM